MSSQAVADSPEHEAPFNLAYTTYCGKLNALGVPMQVWKEVLVEMYFPVNWSLLPSAFRKLAHEIERDGDDCRYDLNRPEGMTDHDYARGLLKQAKAVRDDRSAMMAEMAKNMFGTAER